MRTKMVVKIKKDKDIIIMIISDMEMILIMVRSFYFSTKKIHGK